MEHEQCVHFELLAGAKQMDHVTLTCVTVNHFQPAGFISCKEFISFRVNKPMKRFSCCNKKSDDDGDFHTGLNFLL